MIYADIELAKNYVEPSALENANRKAWDALEKVQARSGPGSEWLGWQSILENPDTQLLNDIVSLSDHIRSRADVFIICGIGGSYLGAKAVIDALSQNFITEGPEIIFAGHHMSGKYLDELLQYLSTPKADGSVKSVYVNVISKSGTTLETALAFKVLREWMEDTYADSSQRIICTTSEEGGVLNEFINRKGYTRFVIPDDVGGRFSVLTPVGLLPISVAGININELFKGAEEAYNSYTKSPENIIEYAALRYALYSSGITVDLFTSFEPELYSFGGWIQQLLGESEGKEGKGIFPSVASFSTDLHSIGQFVQQGKRSLMETFLVIKNSFSNISVPAADEDVDGLGYLAGMQFHDINQLAREGTTEAHKKGDVPIVNIYMESLDERNIGQLIYYFELFTAVYCYCLNLNPFDQPGVEDYKKAMYRLLGKV